MVWNKGVGTGTDPMVEQQLYDDQKEELQRLLCEFSDSMMSEPGQTTLMEHRIETGDTRPI